MDKKKIIQLVVIIIAFGGSGVVLYNGLYRPKPQAPLNLQNLSNPLGVIAPPSVSPLASGASNQLLPFGSKLDFDGVLNKHGLQYDAVSFPAVNTSTDVGIYDPQTGVYTQPLIK